MLLLIELVNKSIFFNSSVTNHIKCFRSDYTVDWVFRYIYGISNLQINFT